MRRGTTHRCDERHDCTHVGPEKIGHHLEQNHVGVGRQAPGGAPLVEACGDRVLGGDVHARRSSGVPEVAAQVVEQVTAPRAFDEAGAAHLQL